MRQFWQYVAMAEKFSEHPIGKAVYAEACKVVGEPRDPDHVEVLKGCRYSASVLKVPKLLLVIIAHFLPLVITLRVMRRIVLVVRTGMVEKPSYLCM